MPVKYSKDPNKIIQRSVPDSYLTAVGKLVRAVADFETLVDLYAMNVTGMSNTAYFTVVGQLGLSSKIAKIRDLAKDAGAGESISKVLTRDIEEIIRVRNYVAHGTFLGVDEQSTDDNCEAAFFINRPYRNDATNGFMVIVISEKSILNYAQNLNRNFHPIARELGVIERLLKLRQQPLLAHPKAQ